MQSSSVHTLPAIETKVNAVLVNVCTHTVTPGRALQPSDLGLDPEKIPPKTLATLGSLMTFPKDALSFVETTAAQIRAICFEKGTKRMGLAYMSDEHFAEALPRIQECIDAFYAKKAEVIASWNKTIDEHVKKDGHKEFEERLRAKVPKAIYLEQRLQCYIEFARVTPVVDSAYAEINAAGATSFDDSLASASRSALEQIAVEANEIWDASLHDRKTKARKIEVTQKILRPIRRIKDKLTALVFVDARFKGISDWIADRLAKLPANGKMTGSDLQEIVLLVGTLRSPEQMLLMSDFASATGTVATDAQQDFASLLDPEDAAAPDASADEDDVDDVHVDLLPTETTLVDVPAQQSAAPEIVVSSAHVQAAPEVVEDEEDYDFYPV